MRHPLSIDLPGEEISDEVLLLRPFTEADVPAILAACKDRLIKRYNSAPSDEREARAWAEGEFGSRPHARTFRLAIVDIASKEFIGSLGVPDGDPKARRAEIGYWVAPSARGRGLATRAVRLFCAWAFSELALARIEAIPEVENRASQRVLDRVGFRREGVLRSYDLIHGRRRDMVVYSVLPGELE